jgi:putative hydrolase of the HAD superfamily
MMTPIHTVPNVRAVLFDYGLVLTGPPDPAALATMLRVLQADEPSFQAAYWRHRDGYDRGSLSGVAYWRAVASDVCRALDADQLSALIAADTALWTQPNLPMIDWAARLQRAGIKTGILSNLGDEMEAGIRERFGWLRGFAHHTFSHHLGIAKPDAAIYTHAALGLGVKSEEILFVDDKPENIAAARAAGMTAIQYTSYDDLVRSIGELGLSALLLDEERRP